MSLNSSHSSAEMVSSVKHLVCVCRAAQMFRTSVTLQGENLHLQHHDDVRLALEGVHTLHQFGVMEAVHDADLLPDVLLLLGRVRFDELSGPNLLGGFLHQLEDLTELPPETQSEQVLVCAG